MKIIVGREYRLLPDAYHSGGKSLATEDGVTRVRVAEMPDMDGDVPLTALDGPHAGKPAYYLVQPEFLAPPGEPVPVHPSHDWSLREPAPWAVGDEAIVAVDEPRGAMMYAGDRVRITALNPPVVVVQVVSGRGVAGVNWYISPDDLLRPALDCTHGADCQVHPDERRLHNRDADELPARVAELEARMVALEARLQGVIDTHRLRDGS